MSSYREFALAVSRGPIALLQFHFIQTDSSARNLKPGVAVLGQGVNYCFTGIEEGRINFGILMNCD